jgi:hypothetical protein
MGLYASKCVFDPPCGSLSPQYLTYQINLRITIYTTNINLLRTMKLSSYLYLLTAVALGAKAAPVSNSTLPHILSSRDGIIQQTNEKLAECSKVDLHNPALDEYIRAVDTVCDHMFPRARNGSPYHEYNLKRIVYSRSLSLSVFDWPTEVVWSFKVSSPDLDLPVQTMSNDSCRRGFTGNWNDAKVEKNGLCLFTKKDGGKVTIMRGWEFREKIEGYATLKFQAGPR